MHLRKALNQMFLVCIGTAPWYIAVGVFTIIGQTSEQVTLVTHESEAVSNPRAGRRAVSGWSGLQLLPQPATRLSHTRPKSRFENSFFITATGVRITAEEMWRRYLKFIQAAGVFPILNHAAKHQYSSAFTDEAMGSTAGRDVTPHRRKKPLLWDWKNGQMSAIALDTTSWWTLPSGYFVHVIGKQLLQTDLLLQ